MHVSTATRFGGKSILGGWGGGHHPWFPLHKLQVCRRVGGREPTRCHLPHILLTLVNTLFLPCFFYPPPFGRSRPVTSRQHGPALPAPSRPSRPTRSPPALTPQLRSTKRLRDRLSMRVPFQSGGLLFNPPSAAISRRRKSLHLGRNNARARRYVCVFIFHTGQLTNVS